MDNTKLKNIGFKDFTSIDTGIQKTMNWYKKNLGQSKFRYNSFIEKL
jgi:nucleoside-diphosphate-sugar epimerase